MTFGLLISRFGRLNALEQKLQAVECYNIDTKEGAVLAVFPGRKANAPRRRLPPAEAEGAGESGDHPGGPRCGQSSAVLRGRR